MGNDDGAADGEGDAEHLKEFLFGDAGVPALDDVIGNAVVAPEDHGSDETEHFLGADVERSRFVREGIDTEKPFNRPMIGGQYSVVHLFAERLKFFNTVAHRNTQWL